MTTLTGSVEMSSIIDEDMKELEKEFSPLTRSYGEI